MDYEKKYNEALERARALWREAIEKEYVEDYLKDYETIFPELRESEDERIRRTLVEYFGPKVQLDFVRGIPIQKIRDWLEKQKEHSLRDFIDDFPYSDEQKEQKPVEPSDEELQRHQDELYDFKVFAAKQAREHHISFVHDFEWNNFCAELLSYFNEKQKPAWKPSEEQLNALNFAITYFMHETNYNNPTELRELYEQLKKL